MNLEKVHENGSIITQAGLWICLAQSVSLRFMHAPALQMREAAEEDLVKVRASYVEQQEEVRGQRTKCDPHPNSPRRRFDLH